MAKQTLPAGTHVPKKINLNTIKPGRFIERKKNDSEDSPEFEEDADETQRIQDGFKFLDDESD